jgi:hypothetical protein
VKYVFVVSLCRHLAKVTVKTIKTPYLSGVIGLCHDANNTVNPSTTTDTTTADTTTTDTTTTATTTPPTSTTASSATTTTPTSTPLATAHPDDWY